MDNEALLKNLEKYLRDTDEIEVILLKGHLILEQILNELLRFHIKSQKSLNSLNLLFSKKLDLFVALQDREHLLKAEVEQLREINRIRNKLAHRLDFSEYHSDLKSWACTVVGYTPATINRKRTYRNTLVSSRRKI